MLPHLAMFPTGSLTRIKLENQPSETTAKMQQWQLPMLIISEIPNRILKKQYVRIFVTSRDGD
jgi:uncharacterized LabA/DUF88 family protein